MKQLPVYISVRKKVGVRSFILLFKVLNFVDEKNWVTMVLTVEERRIWVMIVGNCFLFILHPNSSCIS